MKYEYTGKNNLLLVLDNEKINLRRGQIVELPEKKVKTTKLTRFMKPVKTVEDQLNSQFTKEEIKRLKKLLKEAI